MVSPSPERGYCHSNDMEIGEQRPTYDKVLWMSRQAVRYKIDENAHLEQCQMSRNLRVCLYQPVSFNKYNPPPKKKKII